MRLILVRHGNTFDKGDKIIRIGANQDLPLTEEGIKQATDIGKNLKEKNIIPKIIYTSSLKRTKSTAEKICESLDMDKNIIEEDDRINEIDYGKWTELTDEEIIEKFGNEELEKWNNEGVWVDSANWKPQESVFIYGIRSYLAEILTRHKRDTVITVTSNGVLKYFLKLMHEEFNKKIQEKNLKVKTGNCVDIRALNLNNIILKSWNINPSQLENYL